MEKTRQIILKNLHPETFSLLQKGQVEAAKVWNYCVEQQHKVFKKEKNGPVSRL